MPTREGYPKKTYRPTVGANKPSVPILKPRKKHKKTAGASFSDKLKFNISQPPEGKKESIREDYKKAKGTKDKDYKTSAKEELKRGVAKGLATASAGISGRGRAGRVLKAGLAGAAGGAEIEASYQRFKDKAAKKRAKKAKTTVSQSAMAQKAQFHKKEHSKTEKT